MGIAGPISSGSALDAPGAALSVFSSWSHAVLKWHRHAQSKAAFMLLEVFSMTRRLQVPVAEPRRWTDRLQANEPGMFMVDTVHDLPGRIRAAAGRAARHTKLATV